VEECQLDRVGVLELIEQHHPEAITFGGDHLGQPGECGRRRGHRGEVRAAVLVQ
jgi:hypothetical protein